MCVILRRTLEKRGTGNVPWLWPTRLVAQSSLTGFEILLLFLIFSSEEDGLSY